MGEIADMLYDQMMDGDFDEQEEDEDWYLPRRRVVRRATADEFEVQPQEKTK